MEFKNDKLNEFEEYIKFRKVAIIGLGVSNLPLLDYMFDKRAKVSIFDEREEKQISKEVIDKIKNYGFKSYIGKNSLENLNGFDIIFRSPSCLPTRKELQQEEERGAMVTTEIEMLMKMCPCKTIGVTGSDGKTTTTSLIYSILQNAGFNTYLGGNIGNPLFTKLAQMKPEDIVVLELSSFQLMGMEISPNISVITNITPNHLNIHKDYEEYIEAKKNIFKYQKENDILILNYDNDITRECSKQAKGKVTFFSRKEKLDNGFIVDGRCIKKCEEGIREHIFNGEDAILRGNHNLENIATALAVTKDLVPAEQSIETLKSFKPVEHRIEFVKEINQVKWYNDSASSSPTRTLSGLNAFDEDIVLISGGYDKNLDYKPLAKPIAEKVKALLLIGQTSGKIFEVVKQELENQSKSLDIYMCETLEETVKLAKKLAKPQNVVLFSPASASFDMFKDFADRGNQFKQLVNEL
ncbi:MAG: UDP-N-acetylmuramoyl-L-alanine--D-glutamate ligase [Clostridia bacterium]|nr:UDP-N-acetylmuramoyl-L-alanine--D-glutamate ligase [Clostridia bacterium]